MRKRKLKKLRASEDEDTMRRYRGDKINTKNKTKFAKEWKVRILLKSYQLDLESRCYFTALHRSRHDKAGTTKVARVKATKHKANAATNEVRVENRSHGLAWSQSGDNKTPQALLSFIIPKLLPRNEIRRALVKTPITFMKTLSSSLLSQNAIIRDSWCSFSLSCTLFL